MPWCFGRWVWAALPGDPASVVNSPSGSGGEIHWSFRVNLSGQPERPTNVAVIGTQGTGVIQTVIWSPAKWRSSPWEVNDGSCIRLIRGEEPAGVGKHVTEDSRVLH